MMRIPNDSDDEAVRASFLRMLEKSPAPQMKLADIDTAMAYYQKAKLAGDATFVGSFLLLSSIGCPWYTKYPVLIEDLILRIYPGKDEVEHVIEALDWIAESCGCHAIAVGDTQIGYMTPKYEAAGYQRLGTQLFKPV